MAAAKFPTWIAVMDGAQAQFFVLRKSEDGQIFEEAIEARIAAPRFDRGGKPGRANANGKARGVVEPRQNIKKLEKREFVHEVADLLDAAAEDKAYGQLVLVAPPRVMGELRDVLSEKVLKCLSHEFPKTLTNLPPDVLWSKLSKMLLTAAKPLSGKTKGKTKPAVPVSVQFRNTEASQMIESEALRYAAKLSRKFADVKGCKVVVEAPRRRSLKGKNFEIGLDVAVPGRTIAVKSEGGGMHTHENAHKALRDAFEAVERRMRDRASRRAAVARKAALVMAD